MAENSNDRIKHLENKFSIARYELIKICDGDELRFYLYLKLYAINKHEAFPSYSTIKKDLGLANVQTSRLIRRMTNQGRLKVGKREISTKGGKQTANIYDISWYDKVNNTGKLTKKEVITSDTTLFNKGNYKGILKGDYKVKSELSEKILTIKNPPSDKPTTNSSPLEGEEWDSKSEVEKLLGDKNRHIQIIGLWLKDNGLCPENAEQLKSVIKRNVRPAMLLKGYTDEDIIKTIGKLKKTDYIEKFTIETIGRYIDEVVAGKEIKKAKERRINGRLVIGYKQIRKIRPEDGTPYMTSVPIFEGEEAEEES